MYFTLEFGPKIEADTAQNIVDKMCEDLDRMVSVECWTNHNTGGTTYQMYAEIQYSMNEIASYLIRTFPEEVIEFSPGFAVLDNVFPVE